jgi:glutamyl-Q tRNA(Asp) synthetase
MSAYVGRFAPSPTGLLHAGSLVAALASWLDARAHGGRWLVRIEDVDVPRCVPGAGAIILEQLAACGLRADELPVYQSQRADLYQHALDQLVADGRAFPCSCSRKDIETAWASRGIKSHGALRARNEELIYPGTCRDGLHGRTPRAWRMRTAGCSEMHWVDRASGPQSQNVEEEVGDFVLRRTDGLWAYQLAVVVDDAAQGVTHVVRGQDLQSNTARQVVLQRALGLLMPQYLHTPLVAGVNGEKLSKQNGAAAVDTSQPLAVLQAAGHVLGIKVQDHPVHPEQWLALAVGQWNAKYA